ncbi:FAD:protein FMN transferase [Fructobacillus tropaeoli]|uniref:FAD:protein FMN transferase n=1 Tax=Fructobacillus tropaeoli TaxID=709323 RepID=A0A3F3H8K2_9LACO|nr:FAD:protein FMN transferase [Fructobacillus tropaeoli]GAP03840.1 thiamine biosynthesis lipoprotein [Fructobacillus tropaeoli]
MTKRTNEQFHFLTHVVGKMNIPFTISVAVFEERPALQECFQQQCQKITADLDQVNAVFSPFKPDSLVSRYAAGEREVLLDSTDFQEVFLMADQANHVTEGFFDPFFKGQYDPTGIVKGWAIEKIFNQRLRPLLTDPLVAGVALNGGGDIQAAVANDSELTWMTGIENPRHPGYLIGKYPLTNAALATSGVNKRGEHIKRVASPLMQVTIVDYSLTIADTWATAGIAAGTKRFLELIKKHQLTGVLIDAKIGEISFEKGQVHHAQTI